MNSFLAAWSGLETQRKIVAILGIVALATILATLTRMAIRPSMDLLYAGLEPRQSGDIVRALEQRGLEYEIRGGTIFVPTSKRDELRMTLASEGLPANSAQGYELLDSLSGFGTTSQMFDAAYIRAKEGELARTIVSSPQISAARVHIAQPRSNAFTRTTTASASVFITPAGGQIDSSQAKALKFLVSSAVAGLRSDDVSVVDDQGNLLGTEDVTSAGSADAVPEAMKARVERLLAARVGAGNAIVEISLEKVMQKELITERIFDPESRVAISTDSEERTDSAEDSGSGGVTVASNLPDGDGASQENSKSQGSETRERINYEVSETQREVVRSPGAIKRMTVAVLVNGVESPDTPGEILPRTEEELGQLKELVSSAVGFDESRGDVITVQSMAFSPVTPLGTAPLEKPLINTTLDAMTLIQMGILALVGLIVALAVVRPILKRPTENMELPALAGPSDEALGSAENNGDFQPLSNDFEYAPISADSEQFAPPIDGIEADMAMGGSDNLISENPVDRLREMIETRQEETVDILRNWLEQKENQGT